uniref:ORF65b n=1 Tax=Saccharolobus islandicus TaxID=43080 RepID=Q9C4Y0_SACIS|nr:ORF65b [Sulfolobus islandicus]
MQIFSSDLLTLLNTCLFLLLLTLTLQLYSALLICYSTLFTSLFSAYSLTAFCFANLLTILSSFCS